MNLQFHCVECLDNSIGKNYFLPLNDSYFYEVICDSGHKTTFIVGNAKFDLLFDSAINALQDGYFREAVTSFYAALENFYVEMVQQLLTKAKVGIEQEAFLETYNSRINLSERNLGAYYLAYLLAFRKPAPVFAPKMMNLRNNVIHGKKYPTKVEAIKFGEAVRDYIYGINEDFSTLRDLSIFNRPEIIKPNPITPEILMEPTQFRCYLSAFANGFNEKIESIEEFKTNVMLFRAQREK